jgi:hypothetical protein
MKKRILSLFVAILMVMVVTACSDTDESNNPPANNLGETTTGGNISNNGTSTGNVSSGDVCAVCRKEVDDICPACKFCLECDDFDQCSDCGYGEDCCECEKPLELKTFDPIIITGSGDSVTNAVEVSLPYAIVTFTHNGRSNFIIHQYDDSFNRVGSLVNEIGVYAGNKLLEVDGNVVFNVRGDGDWEIKISPLVATEISSFSGNGDDVSGVFLAPANGVWEFTHDGSSNFIIHLYTSNGRRSIVNEIGAYNGTKIVDFGNNMAWWVVRADGKWTIAPQ